VTRLVLFDIDGTLVLTGGAGARAMIQAFADVFGVSSEMSSATSRLAGVPMAGRTDTWILGEMSKVYNVPSDAETLRRFHDIYVSHLTREIELPGPRKGVLPGVRPLLDALAARRSTLALLTGNFAAGARIKLEHFDLWRYFSCGAFAEDAPDRNSLFGCAVQRVEAVGLSPLRPSEVVIVGDTPHDVEVARVAGARSVAVATGSFSREELLASGADVALDDLSDVGVALAALGVGDE
jgi:phosphoglycolate phosphatase-like HAD superfamily hydrolase